jgi:hypothetical protein
VDTSQVLYTLHRCRDNFLEYLPGRGFRKIEIPHHV